MNLLPLNEASNSYHHPFSRAVPNGFDLSASRWKSHVYCPIRAIDSGLSEPSLQTPDSREINCQTSSVVAGNMCCPIICRIGTMVWGSYFPQARSEVGDDFWREAGPNSLSSCNQGSEPRTPLSDLFARPLPACTTDYSNRRLSHDGIYRPSDLMPPPNLHDFQSITDHSKPGESS
jgi:hypothetical protein